MPNRIREWRRKAGLSQQALADLVGTGRSQIVKLERGERRLTYRWMQRLARHLNCRPIDLAESTLVPVVGYIGAGEDVYYFDDNETGCGLDEVEAPPGAHDGFAVRAKGDSMAPRFFDGDYIFYLRDLGEDPKSCLYRDCVVRLRDGRTLIKRLEPGGHDGTFTLRSYNLAVKIMSDVEIEWVAPVVWVKPHGAA
ncbi:MAG: helix-turn-helix domain-containing protein [Nitrospiraceae bacterium]